MLLKRLINHYKKLNNYYNDLIIIKKYFNKKNSLFILKIKLNKIKLFFLNIFFETIKK